MVRLIIHDVPAKKILILNNTPVKPVKRGIHPRDLQMQLMQCCGSMVSSLAIDDQGMIKLEMKILSTDTYLLDVVRNFRLFNCLDRVHSLILCDSYITGEGLPLLSSFRNLKDLDLSGSFKIKGNEFSYIKCVKTLERLILCNNRQIGKEGPKAVAFMEELPLLTYANLTMTGAGIEDKWLLDDSLDNLIAKLQKNNPKIEILCDKDIYGF